MLVAQAIQALPVATPVLLLAAAAAIGLLDKPHLHQLEDHHHVDKAYTRWRYGAT